MKSIPDEVPVAANCAEQISTPGATHVPARRPNRLSSYVRRELGELRQFIAKPTRLGKTRADARACWTRIGLFLALVLFLDIAYLLSIGLALDSWASFTYKFDVRKTLFMLGALIFAPVMEELVCRAGLRSARYTLFVGPVLIAAFAGTTQIVTIFAAVVILIALAHRFLLPLVPGQNKPGAEFFLGRRFIELYPWIFWLYAGAFAIVHTINYSIDGASGFLVVFAVIPQFIAGICLGYLRLRDGLKSAIALHFLNNSVAIFLSAVFG